MIAKIMKRTRIYHLKQLCVIERAILFVYSQYIYFLSLIIKLKNENIKVNNVKGYIKKQIQMKVKLLLLKIQKILKLNI